MLLCHEQRKPSMRTGCSAGRHCCQMLAYWLFKLTCMEDVRIHTAACSPLELHSSSSSCHAKCAVKTRNRRHSGYRPADLLHHNSLTGLSILIVHCHCAMHRCSCMRRSLHSPHARVVSITGCRFISITRSCTTAFIWACIKHASTAVSMLMNALMPCL